MLELKNIYKKYKGNKDNSLSDCSYVFPDKGFYLISGPSGSGKSTLLGILSGIDTSYEGSLSFNKIVLNKENISSYRNEISTIVFQDLNLIDSLNVENNLRVAFELNGEKYSKEKCIEALKKVNLPDSSLDIDHFLTKKTNQLSIGQKQRIAIARAIIRKSKILFLDEPTSSLDIDNAKQVAKILESLSKEILIILVTHTPEWFIDNNIIHLKLENGVLIGQKEDSSILKSKTETKLKRNHSTTSIHTAFKLSLNTIFVSPFKFIFTTLLAVISLVSCLFFYSAKSIDSNQVSIKNQLNDNNKLCIIQNNQYEIKDKATNVYGKCKFTETQTKELGKMNAHPIIKMDLDLLIYIDEDYSKQTFNLPLLYFMFKNNFSCSFLELWDERDSNFVEDERLKENTENHFPEAFDEIAISSTCANMFLKYGSDKTDFKINDVNELIGKKLLNFKIVNIYTTKEDEPLSKLSTVEDISNPQIKHLFNCFSYSQLFYVAPGYYEHYKTLLKEDSPGNKEAKKLNDSITENAVSYYAFPIKNKEDANTKLNSLFYKEGTFEYKPVVINMYSTRILFDNIMNESISNYIGYILVVFLLLSFLSLVLLFTSNHKKQMNTYSILKALGCSLIGILKISLLEALITAISLFVITLALLWLVFQTINIYLQIELFALNVTLFLMLTCSILIVIIVTTVINFLKISKTNTSILLKEK